MFVQGWETTVGCGQQPSPAGVRVGVRSGMKILLIEDDPETARFISKGMNEHGHRVEHAASGTEGLSRAITGEFDLLVLDRMLPGLDGLSVVKRLRIADQNVPVLFLSNLSGLDDRVNGLEAGGDDYLPKPF